jgi:hypothetical protein
LTMDEFTQAPQIPSHEETSTYEEFLCVQVIVPLWRWVSFKDW